MRLLSGKEASSGLRSLLKKRVQDYKRKPQVTFIIVGEHPPSQSYVSLKKRACEETGIESKVISLPKTTNEALLLKEIHRWNEDPHCDGILVQLPLPRGIDPNRVSLAIKPEKDVDCFHPLNVGFYLLEENPLFLPCTPLGILHLLSYYAIPLEGKEVVILGRSLIVGRPLSILLSKKSFGNSTVTLCHTGTCSLPTVAKRADLLISAMGKPDFIGPEFVKEGSIVIDVGIEWQDGKPKGDVRFDEVAPLVEAISPVPGGVGPMTITALLLNVEKSFLNSQAI